jgi:sulfur carrier protein
MRITVAGTAKDYPPDLTVAQLVAAEKVENPQYVSVAVNDAFVDSDKLGSSLLREGDQVEFLYFMGGGE